MRKITENAVNAFIAGKDWKQGNTQVVSISTYDSLGGPVTGAKLYLHGNLIAQRFDHLQGAQITTAGWPTLTTKERLNGILSAIGNKSLYQKRGEWYIMQDDNVSGRVGKPWQGEWITV